MGAMPGPTVFLHVGLKKTGTSYLQGIFWASVAALEAQGLSMVPPRQIDTFHLMLDVRDRYDPRSDPPRAGRSLERLPGELAAAAGDRALVTEESLAAASPEQVARLAAALEGQDVHLVLTLRDLARQIPSAWQQQLQAGGSVAFEEYVEAVAARKGPGSKRFWRSQDVLPILDNWEAFVPRERVHLVTVPPSGSTPGLLLSRFCEVLGVDPASLAPPPEDDNVSLGRVQAEVLRRVNGLLPQEARRRDRYGDVGKRWFARRVLGPQQGERALLPRRFESWAVQQADDVVASLTERGYRVAGDLADLRPRPESFGDETERVAEEQVADASTRALAAILEERVAHTDAARARRRERLEHGDAATDGATDGADRTGGLGARLRAVAGGRRRR
jgi:hypothetical protein